jgi:protein involved in polysaccharide export with SLBB domain
MYKAFGFLLLLVLFSGSSGQTIAQVTRNDSRPSPATNTEANRLLQQGIELTRAGQLPQAVRALEEAIELDPHYANAYAALGRAYFKMRLWQRAVDNFHRAAALKAKQRQAEKTSQQQSATPSPHANEVQTQQAQNIATAKDQTAKSESGDVEPPVVESQVSERKALEPVGPTGERSDPGKPAMGASTKPQKVPDPSTTGTSTTPNPATKVNAVEVTQQTSPEVTQAQKAPGEAPLKNDAAKASEEMPEPTGVSGSMSASPGSSTVESKGVSPIPLKSSNEDVSLTKIYRVGPGDVLDVHINEAQPQQSTLFTVTSMGFLEHPMLAEPLHVSALTPEEIETKIRDDLKQRALIENPEVIVGVRDYASHAIVVSGLVKESGTKFLRREAIPLYVVVADAQPLPEAAKVTVVRNERKQMFEIDLTKVADMRLLVHPGDVINVQRNETQFIYVGGEVKAPGEKIFRHGLTLTQAIISAGGETPKSKAAEIGRDDGQGFLLKTIFKLKDIQTGKAMDPLIRPGDRIMILR